MKKINKGLFTCAVACAVAGGMLTSCVDDSYDLSDIDLTVNVGGDLGAPRSILFQMCWICRRQVRSRPSASNMVMPKETMCWWRVAILPIRTSTSILRK